METIGDSSRQSKTIAPNWGELKTIGEIQEKSRQLEEITNKWRQLKTLGGNRTLFKPVQDN